ncbi:hypothetical protein POJ06DRAFT_226841 [Lipomyces tetrasporus]|uniref:Uncharacterized protein n=1 Tax=Lipomyces tetrasporus TaxID=54092 RepID=A0AAD7VQM4_9ASCO|nr:uncharacterized protein POJ06DRAFT_226841 [Lipomyces tetrasporus]KAJ8097749.1 hypothetical protein POJ06DRAFT_226841 [Lipomyces tetrasporus]
MSLEARDEDFARLEAELHRSNTSLASQQRESETLMLQNSDLVKQIEDLEHDNHQRGKNAERWRQRFLTEKKALEEAKAQVVALQNAVKSRDESNRELAAQKVGIVQELVTVREKVRGLNTELFELSQANGVFEGRIGELVKQNEVFEHEIELLRTREEKIGTTREIARRYSDPEPVRSLSDELAGSSDSDGSGQTLFEGFDDTEHVDLRAKFDQLRDENGWENMAWLTPDEMANWATAVKKVCTDAGFEIGREKMSVVEVLVAALAKQHLLIEKLRQSDRPTEVVQSDTLAIKPDAQVEAKASEAETDSKAARPTDNQATVVECNSMARDDTVMKLYNIVAQRLPYLRYMAYLVPKHILQTYADDDIAVKLTILLSFFFALILSVALAAGTGIGYWVATSSTANAWCSANHMSFARVMARRNVPWWVGSRIPFVEGLMFRLEGWAANRYGYNRILVS